MTRQEFCEQLIAAKKNSGLKSVELIMSTRMTSSHLLRIEKGKNNFNMKKCLLYISCVNHRLEIVDGNKAIHFKDYETMIKWAKRKREELALSQKKLGQLIGLSEDTVGVVELNKNTMSIDMFLGLCEVFNCKIILKQK